VSLLTLFQPTQEELALYPILDLDAEGELEEDVDTRLQRVRKSIQIRDFVII